MCKIVGNINDPEDEVEDSRHHPWYLQLCNDLKELDFVGEAYYYADRVKELKNNKGKKLTRQELK